MVSGGRKKGRKIWREKKDVGTKGVKERLKFLRKGGREGRRRTIVA